MRELTRGNKMKKTTHIKALSCATAIAVLLSANMLAAQVATSSQAGTASRAAQESYAPPIRQSADGGLILPETTALQAPEGAENLHVTPSGLVVEGGLADMAAETANVTATIENHRVTGADLFAAASALEQAYARAGYILARISLPPQTIRDGQPLKLNVTNGFVEAIDTASLPEKVRPRVEDILAPLTGASDINQGEIERRLLLAGDIPGLALTTTLKPGDRPGGTIIVVDGKYRPVSGSINVDNSMPASLGRISASAGIEFNNLFGIGDVVYLRLSGYPNLGSNGIFTSDPRNRQLAAGFTMPLGTDGLWANAEILDSQTHPTSSAGFTIVDHYQRFSGNLGYSWLRSRKANIASSLTFDVTNETQTLDVSGVRSAFTEDRLRVLRFKQSGDYFTSAGGYLSGSLAASFGLDAFGARHATTSLPLSRSGASPNFAKLTASGQFSQNFAGDAFLMSLSAEAQTTFGNAVVSSEQLSLGGAARLSAFGSGDIQADQGAFMRAEFSYSGAASRFTSGGFQGAASPYVFAAAGIARLEQPTAVEQAVTGAAALGIGARLTLSQPESNYASTLSLEYAHGFATNAALNHRNRFTFGFRNSF